MQQAPHVLILEAATGFGGSINSLVTMLRAGLAARYRCTIGHYADLPMLQALHAEGIALARLDAPLAQSGLARLAGRTSRVQSWRQKLLGEGALSQMLEVWLQAPQVALQVRPLARQVSRLIATQGVDLLHLNDSPALNLDGVLAAAQQRVPCVCHLRSPGRLNRQQRRLAVEAVTRFVAVSEAVKRHWVDQGLPAERIAVIHNARPPMPLSAAERAATRATLDVAEETTVIAFAGRLLARKGVAVLLAAVAQLAGHKLAVWVLGDGDQRAALVAQAAALGIAERVRFLGYRSDAAAIVAAADIAVIPSTYEDPFPSSVLEAMAAGLPVVGSDIGGIPEAVVHGETGWLVPAGEADALASALASLVRAPELRRQMGAAALQRLRAQFAPARQAHEMDLVYQRALGHTERIPAEIPAEPERGGRPHPWLPRERRL